MALYTDLGKQYFPDIYNSQSTLNYFINLCGWHVSYFISTVPESKEMTLGKAISAYQMEQHLDILDFYSSTQTI